MSELPATDPLARLLTHAAFLQRLAARLAGPDDGDDLAQDAWLAAARAAPAHGGNERGWLATIAANLWRNRRREDHRRRRRDADVVRHADVPDVAQIAAREELRARVVGAVLALPVPLREVVLLRYFEGLDSPAIAARLGIAPSTVRTRHQQAVAALRSRLDADHGGDRAAWVALALQLAASARAPGIAAASPVPAVLLATVLAAATVLAVVLWGSTPAGPVPAAPADAAVPVAAAPAKAAALARADEPAVRESGAAPAGAAETVSTSYPWTRPRTALHGIVLDGTTRAAVAGCSVALRSVPLDCSTFANVADDAGVQRDARSGPDGTFVVEALPVGRYELEVDGPDGRHGFFRADVGVLRRRLELAVFARPERGRVSVRVVDEAGAAVPDARVTLAVGSRRGGWFGWLRRPPLRGVTGANGRFELQRPELDLVDGGGAWVADGAGRTGYAFASQEASATPLALEVVVRPAGAIAGRLTGLSDWRGVRVVAHPAPATFSQPDCFGVAAAVDAAGAYRIEGLAAGSYQLQVDGLARRADKEQFWNTPVTVVEPARVVTAVPPELACVAGGTVRVEARASDGEPIAGAAVLARRAWVNRVDHYVLHHGERDTGRWFLEHDARTDDAGRCALALPAGRWQVAVTAPGRTLDVALVELANGNEVAVAATLVADGALAGTARGGAALRSRTRPDAVHVLPDAFHVRGLAPGTWEVGTFDAGKRVFTVRVTVEIAAGATTWIDVDRAEERVHRGVLRHAGAPLADHEVAVGDRGVPVRTGRDGAFELRHVHGAGEQESLHVRYRGLLIARLRALDGEIDVPGRVLEVRTLSVAGQPEPATIDVGDVFDGHGARYDAHNGPGRVVCDDGVLRFVLAGESARTAVVATFADGSRVRQLVSGRGVVQLVRPATAALTVCVRGGDGTPVAGHWVRALAWGRDGDAPADPAAFAAGCAEAEEWVQARTAADGTATLRGVPAGAVLVETWPPGGTWRASVRHRVVRLAPGAALRVEIAGDR